MRPQDDVYCYVDGSGLTGGQRFRIGWAQLRASLDRGDTPSASGSSPTPHSPNECRTDQVLRNMSEFHAAFGTKPATGCGSRRSRA